MNPAISTLGLSDSDRIRVKVGDLRALQDQLSPEWRTFLEAVRDAMVVVDCLGYDSATYDRVLSEQAEWARVIIAALLDAKHPEPEEQAAFLREQIAKLGRPAND